MGRGQRDWSGVRRILDRAVPYAAGIAVIALVVFGLVARGYALSWTGFASSSYTEPGNVKVVPAKTLWDWLQLLIVPAALAVVAYGLNRTQKSSELRITESQQEGAALQGYFDKISELVLKYDLSKPDASQEVQTIARARTLATLQQLSGRRKGLLIRFLVEGNLIHERLDKGLSPRISLSGANLGGADLSGIDFEGVRLFGVDLRGAHLDFARLKACWADETTRFDQKWQIVMQVLTPPSPAAFYRNRDFRRVDFCGARLFGADLSGSDLRGAILDDVYLRNVTIDSHTRLDEKWRLVWQIHNQEAERRILDDCDLGKADLSGTILRGASLRRANLTGANLSFALFNDAIQVPDAERPDLSGATLSFCKLNGALLVRANLNRCFAVGATFDRARLSGATLTNGYFDWSSFRDADLTDANLRDADLSETQLQEANLTGADLTGATVKGCQYDARTRWPQGFDPIARGAKLDVPDAAEDGHARAIPPMAPI